MKLLRPSNVHEATAIAVQIDTKLAELKPIPQKLTVAKPQLLALPNVPVSRARQGVLPLKKLVPAELQSKKEKRNAASMMKNGLGDISVTTISC